MEKTTKAGILFSQSVESKEIANFIKEKLDDGFRNGTNDMGEIRETLGKYKRNYSSVNGQTSEKSSSESSSSESTNKDTRRISQDNGSRDVRYQKEIDSEGNKVYAMPDEAKEIFNKYYSKWETIERVSVKKLINDNYLNDPIKQSSVESRRSKTWGKSSSEYKFDTDKADIESIKYQSAIAIREDEKGKYILRDGNHRVIALNNEGYKYVDVLKAKSSDTRYQKKRLQLAKGN